ncbi:MAG: hypothetical protein PHF56_23680 [Desulfuromonadaceae bacterium]|nr:hypothetical protein [Desulfuromonadaceae bacterium]
MNEKPIINPYLAVLVGVYAVSFSALFVRLATAPALTIATYRLLFTFLLLAPFALFRYRTELVTRKQIGTFPIYSIHGEYPEWRSSAS